MEVKYDRLGNLAEAPSNTRNKRSLIRTSQVYHRPLAVGRSQQVKEYKYINTYTHVVGLQFTTLLLKTLWHRCSHVNFEDFKSMFFTEHLQGLIPQRSRGWGGGGVNNCFLNQHSHKATYQGLTKKLILELIFNKVTIAFL